jgi:hypothetical protein
MEQTAARVLAQALRFKRMGHVPLLDPLECRTCGKPWGLARHASECCTSRGIARDMALDDTETRERTSRCYLGSFEIIEADLMSETSERMEALLQVYAGMRDAANFTPIRRYVIEWQKELRELLMTDEDRDAETLRKMEIRRRRSRKQRMAQMEGGSDAYPS